MLERHSVTLTGHKTSISIEPEFWQEVKMIAHEKDISINQLVASIDNVRGKSGSQRENLSSEIRLFVLRHVRK
ncbi:MAG: ribbon-helix-helix domain-containing protein [Rickettsiales bacterium]|jgi:predicted DNA-binding ribbon-helix-helix protein|nr:ribbon-helix-helix domain-containing protein [Rickettsiales bacterium]